MKANHAVLRNNPRMGHDPENDFRPYAENMTIFTLETDGIDRRRWWKA